MPEQELNLLEVAASLAAEFRTFAAGHGAEALDPNLLGGWSTLFWKVMSPGTKKRFRPSEMSRISG